MRSTVDYGGGVAPIAVERRNTNDVIFAPATPAGGAIAIMRVSGPGCDALVRAIGGRLPAPRRATVRPMSADDGTLIDRGIILWFPGPDTATGEDAAEFHVHGGAAVLMALGDALLALGARPADAGEFTRRAFLAGRVDLLEAEGIADLVAAETEEQRRQALAQSEGGLSRPVRAWTDRVRFALAAAEAAIDFPDEFGDHGSDVPPLADDLDRTAREIAIHLEDGARAERLRTGVTVVLTGAVNVGKSTILNRLCGHDAAIVSADPGTTRDRVEARVVLGGVPVTLVDTAGFRDSDNAVEREGMRRAAHAVEAADLVLHVRTADQPEPAIGSAGPVVDIVNKIDQRPAGPGALGVSAETGENFEALRTVLAGLVARIAGRSAGPVITRGRHRHALTAAHAAILQALRLDAPELRAETLRHALRHLGSLTGAVGTEDLLDTIFSTFCIGK